MISFTFLETIESTEKMEGVNGAMTSNSIEMQFWSW